MTDSGHTNRRASFPWRKWGLALCAVLALAALLWPREAEPAAPAEESLPAEAPVEAPAEAEKLGELPQVIPLEGLEESPALREGDAAAALASEDVVFSDRLDSGAELEIRRANPVTSEENGGVFYDVYALTRTPDTDWRVLGCLSDYSIYVGMGGLDLAERVENILGHEGWQISLAAGASAVRSWYFAAGPEGAEFLLDASGTQCAQVADLDGDGEGEVWGYYNHGIAGWSLYDRDQSGRVWIYFLPVRTEAPVAFLPEGGCVPADEEGKPFMGKDGDPIGWTFYDVDASGQLWGYFPPTGARALLGKVPEPETGFETLLGPYVLEDGALRLQEN